MISQAHSRRNEGGGWEQDIFLWHAVNALWVSYMGGISFVFLIKKIVFDFAGLPGDHEILLLLLQYCFSPCKLTSLRNL